MKPTLSVCMITFNESSNLTRSLESVKFADEIIIVDRHSTDETVAIAKTFNAKVIEHDWLGFGQQKNLALSFATKEWVLSLDADEVITSVSHIEIDRVMKEEKFDGFYFPRLAFIGKLKIRHGGWYPDYQLRLVKRASAKFEDKPIHERMIEPAKVAYLTHPIEHYSYISFAHWVEKMNHYTDLEADKKKFSLARLLFKPPAVFLKSYIWQSGWLDGTLGLIVATLNAYYKLIVEVKRFEKKASKHA